MIIKAADDKRQEIAALERLLARHAEDARRRDQIEQMIRRLRAGIRGEEEAAYEMRVHWGDSKDWMVIHDLRVRHDDLTAQIDHLLMNRWLEIWVCESKRVSQGMSINDRGEFTVFSEGKPRGIPSPIEQVRRQSLILQRLLDARAVELPTRLGFTLMPEIRSLVLVSRHGRITRPRAPIDGIDCIVKADQLRAKVETGFGDKKVSALARAVGQETLEKLARALVGLHEPVRYNWAARLRLAPAQSSNAPQRNSSVAANAAGPDTPRPACHICGAAVTKGVARYCRSAPRFEGRIYCLTCQKSIESVLTARADREPASVVPVALTEPR